MSIEYSWGLRLFFSGFFPGCFSFPGDYDIRCKSVALFIYFVCKAIRSVWVQLTASYYPFDCQVTHRSMLHESIFVDSQLRHMPEHHHGHLKSVKISGFSSAKCLIELTCYILKNAVSLECLTLDTICGNRCYDEGGDNWCVPMADPILVETPRTLSAIRTYIENKVPSTVKLTVLEPCNKCHGKRLERLLSLSRNVISI